MDLLYGHLGEAVYDHDSQIWHFARDASSKRYMFPLCPLLDTEETETDSPAEREVRQLERAFPGVDHAMLQDFLQVSETVDLATSQNDPNISDLISYGNAADETMPKKYQIKRRLKPMVALASGAAGESLRLIVLRKEMFRWKDLKGVDLHAFTTRNGLEAWWTANGGKIQQVTFADQEVKANSWLAVRHQGAISILNPQIHENLVCPSNANGYIHGLPASRLDANHALTIVPADAGGMPFADVAFEPWDFHRFVTIDQAGRWQIWNMKRSVEYLGVWSPAKDVDGSTIETSDSEELKPILDGWARALWAVDSGTLVAASRTTLTIFDTKAKPVRRHESDLELAKSLDWILDIQKDPTSQKRLLVLTSSRLLLLEIRNTEQRSEKSDVAIILVSWIHFRAHEDISLSLSVISHTLKKDENQHEDTTMVTLYSRRNGLASVFGFRHSDVTKQASSSFDPCLLPLPNTGSMPRDPRESRKDQHFQYPPFCLQATSTSIARGQGAEHQGSLEQVEFYVLRALNHDWSLSEHLYVASKAPNFFLKPPDIRKGQRRTKTPVNVTDDFIAHDGFIDDPAYDTFPDVAVTGSASHPPSVFGTTEQKGTEPLNNGVQTEKTLARSLDMKWLVEQTRDQYGVAERLPFKDTLDVIQKAIIEKQDTARPGCTTLLESCSEEPLMIDIDEAAANLSTLLASLVQANPDAMETEVVSNDHRPTVVSLLPQISDKWRDDRNLDLLQVYDRIIRSEISPLPTGIPGRVRLELEKKLRPIAIHIFLAAHAVFNRIQNSTADNGGEADWLTQDSKLLLPVREKDAFPLSTAGSDEMAGQSPSLSQTSTPQHRQAVSQSLPKKQKSSKVDRNFVEDSSSVYLRSLVSLTPQPSLPKKLSNILSYWRVGDDPATYDWQASQLVTLSRDDEAILGNPARQDRNATTSKKRPKNVTGPAVLAQGEIMSQPVMKRTLEARSQEAPLIASTQTVPESSQMGGSLDVSTQPLAGKYASGKKTKKGRKKGF